MAVGSFPFMRIVALDDALTSTAAELVYGTEITWALNRLPSVPRPVTRALVCTTPAVIAPVTVARC